MIIAEGRWLASGLPVAAFPVTGPLDVLGNAPVGVLAEDLRQWHAFLNQPEDVDFDLMLIGRFGCEVHAFDPTPSTVNWIAERELPPALHFHPWAVTARHGADAVRLFLVHSSQVWVPRRFDEQAIRETVGQFLITLKNLYDGIFAEYANFGWEPSDRDPAPADRPPLDRWILGDEPFEQVWPQVAAQGYTGIIFDEVVSSSDQAEEERVQEAVNRFFSLPIFILLGTVIPWAGWFQLGWSGLVLVIAVLFLRRLPTLLLLRPLLPGLA